MKLPWRVSILTVSLLLAAGLGGPAFGKMIQLDGAADLHLLACHREALIFYFSTSGDATQTLCALDPRTGAELWRHRGSNRTWSATVEGGMVYHETGGILFKRLLTNGVVLWQITLDTLPPHKVSPPFSFTRLGQQTLARLLPDAMLPDAVLQATVSLMPSRYGYSAPFLTGGRLLVTRSASAGGGCVIYRCFDDWFLLDPATGQVLQGGAGDLKGVIGPSAIMEVCKGTNCSLFAITEGERRDLRPLVATDGTRFDPAQLAQSYRGPLRSWGSREVFMDGIGNGDLLVLDQAPYRLRRLASPAVRSRAGDNWGPLPGHLVHFTTRHPYYAPSCESNVVPRIELFDLNGQLLGSLDVPGPAGPAVWGLQWVGPLGQDSMAFTRWQAVTINEQGNRREPYSEDLLVFHVPTLRLQRVVPLGPRPLLDDTCRAQRDCHVAPGSPHVFSLTGDVSIGRMKSNSIPHELRIEAIDGITGRSAWRHTEKVVIRKYGS